MPRRSWNVYVLPWSVGVGTRTARLPTSAPPAIPPTRRWETRPSYGSVVALLSVGLTIPELIAGSMQRQEENSDSTRNTPPRWLLSEGRVVDQRVAPDNTRAFGLLA